VNHQPATPAEPSASRFRWGPTVVVVLVIAVIYYPGLLMLLGVIVLSVGVLATPKHKPKHHSPKAPASRPVTSSTRTTR